MFIWRALLQATDPYLKLFRGLAFLRQGAFDFSGVAAILVLVLAGSALLALGLFRGQSGIALAEGRRQ